MTIVMEFPHVTSAGRPVRVTRHAEGAQTLQDAIRILKLPPDDIPFIISPKGVDPQ